MEKIDKNISSPNPHAIILCIYSSFDMLGCHVDWSAASQTLPFFGKPYCFHCDSHAYAKKSLPLRSAGCFFFYFAPINMKFYISFLLVLQYFYTALVRFFICHLAVYPFFPSKIMHTLYFACVIVSVARFSLFLVSSQRWIIKLIIRNGYNNDGLMNIYLPFVFILFRFHIERQKPLNKYSIEIW